MEKSNIERIITVAKALKELNQQVVYVGGAVVQFYSDETASAESRATVDVDCVVKYNSHVEKIRFEERLRELSFREDLVDGVICRWTMQDEKVDIMPTDEKYLSFSNKWYGYGFDKKIQLLLDEECVIYIMPVLVFVASKFEAIRSRGGEDLRCSHDFEDVIYVMNSCSLFVKEFIDEQNEELKQYIKEQALWLLNRKNLIEEIECVLPYGEEERVSQIILKLGGIIDNTN